MTEVQILWGINTGLVALLAFLLKFHLTKIESRIDNTPSLKSCDERYANLKRTCDDRFADVKGDTKILFKHKHAPTHDGAGGEVVIP